MMIIHSFILLHILDLNIILLRVTIRLKHPEAASNESPMGLNFEGTTAVLGSLLGSLDRSKVQPLRLPRRHLLDGLVVGRNEELTNSIQECLVVHRLFSPRCAVQPLRALSSL